MKRTHRRKLNSTGLEKCEICETQTILVQHHIRGRDIPNANHSSNLANICPNCHSMVHNGIIIIEDRLMTTDGKKLIWHHYKEPSLTGNDAKPWLF
jgi:CRISPR/Cas system-associated protein Cas10 (large subunit of type III CRISPR-Cas system)